MKKIMKLAFILSLIIVVTQISIKCFIIKDLVYVNSCHHNIKLFLIAQIMFFIGLFSSLTFIFYFIRAFIQKYVSFKEKSKNKKNNFSLENEPQHQEIKNI